MPVSCLRHLCCAVVNNMDLNSSTYEISLLSCLDKDYVMADNGKLGNVYKSKGFISYLQLE